MPPPTNTATRTRAQDARTFARQIFLWLHAIKADHKRVPPVTGLAVAFQMTEYFNEDGRPCFASYKTIGDAIGKSEATVLMVVRKLEAAGYIRVEWGKPGRHHSNRYWPILKPQPAKVSEPGENLRKKPQFSGRKPQPAKENYSRNHCVGNATHSPTLGGSDEPSVLDSTGSGADARGAPPEPFEEPASHREPEPGGTAETDDSGVHAAWRALVELWAVRPWPMTPRELAIARALFVKAIADGTPIDAILAGGGAWVSAVEDPRYLKALPQWLAARCWEHPPPVKPKRQTGQRRQRREKTDLASMMYQLGRTM